MRVNDYNPLLLMLWQANNDIQYVAESSLALAHYVSGYITKAERSNMLVRTRVCIVTSGVLVCKSLRFRECGVYKASDLLLGDHLNEKSDNEMWVDVSMLMDHKKRCWKLQSTIQTLKRSLRTTFLTPITHRDQQDWKMFVSDFVANYDWYGKDANGDRNT